MIIQVIALLFSKISSQLLKELENRLEFLQATLWGALVNLREAAVNHVRLQLTFLRCSKWCEAAWPPSSDSWRKMACIFFYKMFIILQNINSLKWLAFSFHYNLRLIKKLNGTWYIIIQVLTELAVYTYLWDKFKICLVEPRLLYYDILD